MPANDYRRFTSPDVLKKVSRERLRAFLLRFEPFFSSRGIPLPPEASKESEAKTYDYTELSRAISRPDRDSPPAMVDALHLINEMCSESAHDDMLEAIEEQSLSIDLPENVTTAEIALSIWLHSPAVLSDLHLEQLYTAQRKFEFFKVTVAPVPPFVMPTDKQKREMCAWLDQTFKQTRRGEGCRMYIHEEPGDNIVRILVQHGQTCRRDGNYINNQPETLLYRPEVFDTIHFAKDTGEIAIHCESKRVRQSYLQLFGRYIFQNEEVFQPAKKYTLRPLWEHGENCLSVDGLAGGRITSITLREVMIVWNRRRKDFEIRKSVDLFESMRQRNQSFHKPRPGGVGEIIRAKFDVNFSGHAKPRPLTIAVPNDARYGRDEDGVLIEAWMSERGFILAPGKGGPTDEESDLEVGGDGTVGSDSHLEGTVRE
jgi:hypothetical protein